MVKDFCQGKRDVVMDDETLFLFMSSKEVGQVYFTHHVSERGSPEADDQREANVETTVLLLSTCCEQGDLLYQMHTKAPCGTMWCFGRSDLASACHARRWMMDRLNIIAVPKNANTPNAP